MKDNDRKVEIVIGQFIRIDLLEATEEEKKEYDIEYWGFDYPVRMEEANDIMIDVVRKLNEYMLPSMNIYLSEPRAFSPKSIYTKEAVLEDLDSHKEFILEAKTAQEKALKLTLN